MAASSLRKTVADMDKTEGIYASSDPFPSPGTTLDTDLGLTLHPRSQSQKETEDRSISLTEAAYGHSCGHDEAKTVGQGWSPQSVCGSSGSAVIPHGQPRLAHDQKVDHDSANISDVASQDFVQMQYGDCSPRAQKRRRIECQDLHPSSGFTDSEMLYHAHVSQGGEIPMSVESVDHLHGAKDMESVPSVAVPRVASGEKVSEDFTSKSAGGVFGKKNVLFSQPPGSWPDDSPDAIVSGALKKTTPTSKISNTHLLHLDMTSLEDPAFGYNENQHPPIVPKPFENHKSKLHRRSQLESLSTGSFLPQGSRRSPSGVKSNTGFRGAVSKFGGKAFRFWTSHFPEASIRTIKKRSTPLSSLKVTASSSSPSIATNLSTKTTGNLQIRPRASSVNTQLFVEAPHHQSNNLSTHHPHTDAIVEYQAHLTLKRASSLPTLSSMRPMSMMDSRQGRGLSSLPTPPQEKQTPSPEQVSFDPCVNDAHRNGFMPSTLANTPTTMGAYSANQSHSYSAQQGTYPATTTIAYPQNHINYQQGMSDWGFDRLKGQTVFPNDIVSQVSQQSSGHGIPQKAYHSDAEVQEILKGYERRLISQYQKADTARQSQSQHLLRENARLVSKSKQMKLEMERFQHDFMSMKKRISLYEGGNQNIFQALANHQKEAAYLKNQIQALQQHNQHLVSRMERMAGQPRSNACVAKAVLQKTSSPASRTSGSRNANDEHTNTMPPSMVIPTSNSSQNTLSGKISTNWIPPFQHQFQPSFSDTQSERQLAAPMSEYMSSHAHPGAVNHHPTPLPTSSAINAPATADQPSLAAQADTNVVANNDLTDLRPEVLPHKVLIDLTEQPESEIPVNSQTQATTPYRKKDYAWLDGMHPNRAINTPGENFGLPSSKGAIAARAKSTTKKTHNANAEKIMDAMNSVADLEDTHNGQSSTKAEAKKQARKAALEKKREKKRLDKQAQKSRPESVSPVSTTKAQSQGRRSKRVQVRKNVASQPLAEVQCPTTMCESNSQELTETATSTAASSAEQLSSSDGDVLMNYDDLDALFMDDPVASTDDQGEDLTPAQYQQLRNSNLHEDMDAEKAAAELDALFTAEYDAGSDDGDDDELAAAFEAELEAEAMAMEAAENDPEVPSTTVAIADESEESEEE